jgi:hypothetical protein
MIPPLETERLWVRPVRLEDAADVSVHGAVQARTRHKSAALAR